MIPQTHEFVLLAGGGKIPLWTVTPKPIQSRSRVRFGLTTIGVFDAADGAIRRRCEAIPCACSRGTRGGTAASLPHHSRPTGPAAADHSGLRAGPGAGAGDLPDLGARRENPEWTRIGPVPPRLGPVRAGVYHVGEHPCAGKLHLVQLLDCVHGESVRGPVVTVRVERVGNEHQVRHVVGEYHGKVACYP